VVEVARLPDVGRAVRARDLPRLLVKGDLRHAYPDLLRQHLGGRHPLRHRAHGLCRCVRAHVVGGRHCGRHVGDGTHAEDGLRVVRVVPWPSAQVMAQAFSSV
jgi:hypothetical protein